MKKISLIFSFVVLFALSGIAQSGDFRIGLKLGPSFDWASSGSVETQNDGMGLGFNVGPVCEYYFTDNIAVSSGMNFNFYRMKYRFTDYRRTDDFLYETNVSVDRRLKAFNLEIPLKVKAKFNVADLFDAYVEAGCSLGFNLKDYGKDEFSLHWTDYHDDSYVDYTHQYRAFQPSLVFGVGAEYELNQLLSVFAQLTFNHALLTAFVSSLEKQTGSILRNNFIGVEVGIMF